MHISVFKKEIAENLEISPDCVIVDATLGAAGHSFDAWEAMQSGKLVSFDLDRDAIQRVMGGSAEWQNFSDKIWVLRQGNKSWYLANYNFRQVGEVLRSLSIQKVDGVIADLGWAEEQLDGVEGLAYSKHPEAKLDMRFSEDIEVTAADLLNNLSNDQLKTLFERNADIYGKQCSLLIEAIVAHRPFEIVQDLLKAISTVTEAAHQEQNLLPRVFQALRIAVNTELSTLESFLNEISRYMNREGILLVITFHSGEEKVVEKVSSSWEATSLAENKFDSKVLRPSVEELRENIRARSAKLYAYKFIK